MNKVFEKIETEKSHVNLLKIYEKFLELIKSQKYPDLFLVNYLLIKCQIIFGFKLNYQKCSTCGSTQRIYSVSKDDYGILCYLCSQLAQNPSWTKEAILLFLYLNRDELEKALEYQTGSRLLFAFMQEVYLKLVGVKFSYYE
ncbi:DNA repair protein RecO C-terminal domain-containing protein [Mycoplasmoides fastidiosum]|uniref:DNA repair protein RecO C-terminal domain-containing protein n=1 Tax=Mycoplasmoides fastidiosum TaxID=92758 RepID=UPI002FE6F329